ncbi:hypothetical protein L532_4332 [Bordetella bronchiseptica OSU095]|uniref:hypothetical protein n=1 Tax=Bordetella bronchiseptica TaxID=518 RepID=UPI00049FE262|nr:hypothetical protein [Bordetella bronchiseptica]KDD41156.1 hypothetical protein L532_4332 [Bordetella bronchiseptica OSU095]
MTTKNNTGQAQTVLTDEERERLWRQYLPHQIHRREPKALRYARAIETAVLSKLRAPVADGMSFEQWWPLESHRRKYPNDHPVYLAAREAWDAKQRASAPVVDEWPPKFPVPYPKREDITEGMRDGFERLYAEEAKKDYGLLNRNSAGAYMRIVIEKDWIFYQRAWADALASTNDGSRVLEPIVSEKHALDKWLDEYQDTSSAPNGATPASVPADGETSEDERAADSPIKAAYVENFGDAAGWLSYKGSWFIEGFKAAQKSAPVADEEVQPVVPDDETIAEAWVTASDSDGIAYDGHSFERGYQLGEIAERDRRASAPVAGEQIIAWDVQDTGLGRRYTTYNPKIAEDLMNLGEDVRPLVYASALPPANRPETRANTGVGGGQLEMAQGDVTLPPLPDTPYDLMTRGSIATGGGMYGHEIAREAVFTADQMRAYALADRQQRADDSLDAEDAKCWRWMWNHAENVSFSYSLNSTTRTMVSGLHCGSLKDVVVAARTDHRRCSGTATEGFLENIRSLADGLMGGNPSRPEMREAARLLQNFYLEQRGDLAEALRPFAGVEEADLVGTVFQGKDDDEVMLYFHRTGKSITLGDFRRARAALAARKEGDAHPSATQIEQGERDE